ncbi:hypothetical protein [Rhizobium sp. CAU 1783]
MSSITITNNSNNSANYAVFQKSGQQGNAANAAWKVTSPVASEKSSWNLDYSSPDLLGKSSQTGSASKSGVSPVDYSIDYSVYDQTGKTQSFGNTSTTVLYL